MRPRTGRFASSGAICGEALSFHLERDSQLTIIGRWSELRVVRVRHSEFKAILEEAFVMAGEVWYPREGTREEESILRRKRSEFVRDPVIRVPLASASILVV